MTGLTHRQRDCLDAIVSYDAEFGCAPSFAELQDKLNLSSKSGVHRLICGLEERGYIRRLHHRYRAIEVVRRPAAVPRHRDEPPTPNQLLAFTTPELLDLLAHVGGILGHRLGPAKARETLDRVGARLAGGR